MAFQPTIPEIARAFENDPRNKLSQQMIASGSSMAPTAGGKYGVWDGLARAMQSVAGAYVQRRTAKKYENEEKDYMALMADALGQGGGAAAVPGVEQPPLAGGGAVGGASGLPTPVQQAAPPMVPQAPQMAPVDPLAALPGQGPQDQIAQALAPMAGPQGMASINAMIPITAMTESRNRDFAGGKPVTSPKGAKYAMQTMPGTARDPGFGVTPARSDSPEEFNRVGKEYLGKMLEKYNGDTTKAWAAYNAGPGRVDRAIRKHGESWLARMPSETRAYVAKNNKALGAEEQQANGEYYAGGNQRDANPYGDPSAPTPQTNYQTPEPELPAAPSRPQARGAVQSRKLDAGQKLLKSGNRYAYGAAMRFLEDGMGEQFQSDREALGYEQDLDKTEYSAGLNNRNDAESAKRGAAYTARSNEQNNQFRAAEQTRDFAFRHNDREDQQEYGAGQANLDRTFQRSQQDDQQGFTAGQSALDRAHKTQLTDKQIEGKRLTAQEQRSAKLSNWMNTPHGTKLYKETTDRVSANDGTIALVDEFMAINNKQVTGGIANNTPGLNWLNRTMDSDLQRMQAITETITPKLREAGSGAMSDKDVDMYRKSTVNIMNGRTANAATAEVIKKALTRQNDYETQKLLSQAEGRGTEFVREWSAYKDAVSIKSGTSFDEWKSSIPQYGADGKRK